MHVHEGIGRYDKAVIKRPGLRGNDRFKFGCVADRGGYHLYSERRGGGLEGFEEIFGIWRRYWVEQEGGPSDARCNLLEQLHPLAGHRRLNTGEAGDVAAWSWKARHEAAANRIGNGRENNRDGVRLLQQRGRRRCDVRKNDVGL